MYDLDFKTPNNDGKQKKTAADLMARYKELCAAYPIVSIEDPFDREDWENTKSFNAADVCQVRCESEIDGFRHTRKRFCWKEEG